MFGIHSKFIAPPPCFLGLTQIAQISQAFFMGGKSHRGSPLLCFQWFTQTQRDSTRRLFVGICGFKAKPQISTNFHELFVG